MMEAIGHAHTPTPPPPPHLQPLPLLPPEKYLPNSKLGVPQSASLKGDINLLPLA